ncbi:caspase family protein [bacterium]|nr:caspase family protein [bacterium]
MNRLYRHIIYPLLYVTAVACGQGYSISQGNHLFDAGIAFENAAGIAIRPGPEIVFSSQLHHAGLDNDHLNTQALSCIYPVYGWGTIGIRGRQFTSDIMTDGTYSLMLARSWQSGKAALGLHVNLHALGYNKDRFHLKDPEDPLLAKATSKFAAGMGLSAMIEPVKNLRIGFQIDDINRPDISLEGGQAFKPIFSSLGISYGFNRFYPEITMRQTHFKYRDELTASMGLNTLFLNDHVRVSGYYEKNAFSIGTAALYKSMWLDYEFHYPLNGLNTVTNGSHVFTLSFQMEKKSVPDIHPQIMLITPGPIETDKSTCRIQAAVTDETGLDRIEILLNKDIVKSLSFQNHNAQTMLDEEIGPFNSGRNEVVVRAYNRKNKSSGTIVIEYTPAPQVQVKIEKPPTIELMMPVEEETNSSMMRMKVSVEFILELNDLKVKVNGEEIQLRGIGPVQQQDNKTDMEIELNLEEGNNDIEVIAFNERGSRSERRKIRYNPITRPFYNKLWAIVIGIDQYQDNNIPDLSYAAKDASAVESMLKDKYRFDKIVTLYNSEATRNTIVRAISTSLKDVDENDGVFVFFAGHGCTGEGLEGGPLGYIVPSDGTLDPSEYYVKNIPMSQIKEISQTIRAKHIFYAMDCCYGGLLLRGPEKSLTPSEKANYAFLQNLAEKRVRQVLTAGGQGQPVLDGGLGGHSVFTGRLIQGLDGQADFNHDGYITAEEINFFVRQRVSNDVIDIARRGNPVYQNIEQTPQYGRWFGEGEFIFGK